MIAFFKTGSTAERIVPPGGNSAFLVGFAAAAMAFIAVFALFLSMAVGRLADQWSTELARSATVQIDGPDAEAEVQTVLDLLATTPGIVSAKVLDREAQTALLAPWLGQHLMLDSLPLPHLISVELDENGPDLTSLNLRLAAEAPGASFDDHGYWRRPVIKTARHMRWLAGLSLVLIAATMAVIVVLSANAALAANASIIRTLRLIGARDNYIARAFVRRITARASLGAVVGMIGAMALMLVFPDTEGAGAILSGVTPQGWQWLLPLLVPLFVALTAFYATRMAAYRHLRRAP